MTDTRIAALAELTAPDVLDRLVVVDVSDTSMAASGTDKYIPLWRVVPIVIRKSGDETVNNSSALQNDDHLVLPVVANAIYQFELQLLTNAANATADWKFGWTVPAGTTMLWGAHSQQTATLTAAVFDEVGTGVSQGALSTESSVRSVGSAAVTGGIFFRGVIRVGGTAGNAQLQWAQNTADPSNSKILTDSVLIARRLV